MEKLVIDQDRNTPQIVFDPDANTFEVSGRSFPENSKKFYQPVLDWVEGFEPSKVVNLNFEFYYISSSSIISILELIKKLSVVHSKGADMEITWRYDDDDDDIRKIGEDYSKLTSIPFRFEVNSKG